MDMMPPETRCREEDKAVILAHQSELAAIGEDLVQAFYNTLFATRRRRLSFMRASGPCAKTPCGTFGRRR